MMQLVDCYRAKHYLFPSIYGDVHFRYLFVFKNHYLDDLDCYTMYGDIIIARTHKITGHNFKINVFRAKEESQQS